MLDHVMPKLHNMFSKIFDMFSDRHLSSVEDVWEMPELCLNCSQRNPCYVKWKKTTTLLLRQVLQERKNIVTPDGIRHMHIRIHVKVLGVN